MNGPKIDDIFNQAAEIEEPAERKAYLERTCGNDAHLRAEIDDLLRHDSAKDDLFDQAAPGVRGIDPEIGTQIGPFKIREKIGEGGMGIVYVAEQTEPIQRKVALKIIKPGMGTKEVIARFEAERQALAFLEHPNIARVLDAGATESGRSYFVMELVHGIPITEYCDQLKLPPHDRLALFITVCDAIQYAHQKGIIHRDIKPSNVLITQVGGKPVVKVIDFGLAKATGGQRLTEKTVYTHFMHPMGTPQYMSPEQTGLSDLDIDTRSDIYSLGVLLYELLTGSTPFDTRELMASGLDQMRQIIREREPSRPSKKISTLSEEDRTTTARRQSTETPKLISILRGDLDWIVMKCLEKDRTRRYETANALATDINRHFNHDPVVARPPSTMYRFQKAWRRNKTAYTAVAAVLVALVAGLSFASIGLQQAWRQQEVAIQARNEARASEADKIEEARRAEDARVQAKANALEARRNLYAADINRAQQSLKQNNLGRARRLLDRHRPQLGDEDLRGWEWRYLWQLTRGSSHVKLANRPVRGWDVSLSPDGSRLAVAWKDGQVDLWDAAGPRLIRHLTDRGAPNGAHVAFSPVRNLLAATSGPQVVTLYDLHSGQESQLWRAPDADVRQVSRLAFSQDGSKVAILAASATRDISDEVWVINVPSGQIESRHLTGYEGGLEHLGGVQLSPDGRRLYLARNDYDDAYSIQCIDLDTDRELWQTHWVEVSRGLSTLAISPDGRTLASASGFRYATIRLWDAETGQLLRLLLGHTRWVCNLAFSQDGRHLISAASDQTIRFWDTGTWTEVSVLRGHRDEVHAVAISNAAQIVASASKDGDLIVWKLEENSAGEGYLRLSEDLSVDQVKLLDHSHALLLHPGQSPEWLDLKRNDAPVPLPELGSSSNVLGCFGGSVLCRWNESNQILIHEWRENRFVPRGTVPLDSGTRPLKVVYNVRRQLLAWAETASSNSISLVNLATPDRTIELRSDVPGLIPHGFNEAGSFLLGHTRARNTWRVWNIDTGKIMISIDAPIEDAAFAADGRVLVTTRSIGQDHEFAFYDLASPNGAPRRIPGRLTCNELAVSPDGRWVAGPTWGGEVLLFDAAKRELIGSLHGHMLSAYSATFSPDGRRLVSISPDREIKLWDVGTRQELLTLSSLLGPCRWTADGNVILVGGRAAWRAPTLAEIDAAEAQDQAKGRQP